MAILKYKTLIMLGVVTLVCFGLSITAFAQSGELKFGVVDLQRIIDSSAEGKNAQEMIKQKADELGQQAKQMKDELQTLKEDFEKQSLALTSESRRVKSDEIARLERDYTRFVNDSKSELRLAEQRALRQLLEDVGKLVTEYGKANNYTMIFEKTGILYASDAVDLTAQIVELYNSRNK